MSCPLSASRYLLTEVQYEIYHRTEYLYQECVGFTPQLIRTFPRMDDRIRMSDYQLEVQPEGSIYWLRDPYDNAIAKFFTTEKSPELSITVKATLEHKQESAFDFLLDSHAITFPFSYTPQERRILQAYLPGGTSSHELETWVHQANLNLTGDTTECLTELISSIHRHIKYQRRDAPGIQSAAETIQCASGTCRDYAVLLMTLATQLGLATRYVSGYLYASDEGDTQGADSIHAWTDIYLPGAGWRGLDPTNGIWCGNCHIPLAVAINPEETTPIQGSYCADHPVDSTMKTQLSIQNPSCNQANK